MIRSLSPNTIEMLPGTTIVDAFLRANGITKSTYRCMYEDALPDEMTDEEYSSWFKESYLFEGVRVGPIYSPPKAAKPCFACGGIVEQARGVYVEPLCFACLPPPEPLKLHLPNATDNREPQP